MFKNIVLSKNVRFFEKTACGCCRVGIDSPSPAALRRAPVTREFGKQGVLQKEWRSLANVALYAV